MGSIWPFLQMLHKLSECMYETPLIARLGLKAAGSACEVEVQKLLEGSGEVFSP